MVHATHINASSSNPLPKPQASGQDHSGAAHAEERVTSGGLATSQDGYTLSVEERTLPSGAIQPLHFQIIGPDGAPVTCYTLQHEHDLHAVIIRSDLQHFQHLHPVRDEGGRWTLPLALPEGGSYRLLTDFISDGKELVLGTNLFAAGGHLVALREGDLAYLHAHPMTTAEVKAGPDASVAFHLGVPSMGRYRLFLQFAEGGRISTAAFTLEVPATSTATTRSESPVSGHDHGTAGHIHH